MIAKLHHFHGTFLSGWWRWPTEHFTVFAGSSDRPLQRVAAPLGSYFADPFPWVHAGECWLFLEQFRYNHNRGRLVARRLAGGPILPITLAGRGHASFPCIFAHEGQLYLLPETGGDRTLDLYVCDRFPDQWRLVRHLALDLDAADTVPLHHDGRWWFLTSLRAARTDGGRRSLAIFHCEQLMAGDLVAHPVNTERRFYDSPFSYGRNAGPILRSAGGGAGGELLRPYHASRRYYGEAIGWARLDKLTTTEFHETPFAPAPPQWACLPAHPLHHVASVPGWLACDTRDRFPRSGAA